MTYDCRKRYSVCVPCILWCYNTKSVPLYVSNIHDFDMVHTGTDQYVLFYFVCISTYQFIQVCTSINRYILNTLFLYILSRFQMCQCTAWKSQKAMLHSGLKSPMISTLFQSSLKEMANAISGSLQAPAKSYSHFKQQKE